MYVNSYLQWMYIYIYIYPDDTEQYSVGKKS